MKFDEAMNLRLKRYMPDEPCMRGHIAERVLPNNACVECTKLLRKSRGRDVNIKKANELRIRALTLLNARIKSAQSQYQKALKIADELERKL